MKVLIVGSDKHWAIENFYNKYFNSIEGANSFLFPARSRFYDYLEKSVVNKVIHRLGVSSFYQKINKELLETVKEIMPEIVWVFKGMEIFPETLEAIRAMDIKTINYNPDNPFIFSGRGSGNSNVTESIELYDLHLTYNLEVLDQIRKTYAIPCELLPFAYELPEEVSFTSRVEEVKRLCFLGNPDKDRASFILSLIKRGIPVDVYGNNWEKFLPIDNVGIYSAVYGVEMWDTLRKYRVQLNLPRKHNLQSHNMRSFEIPAVGGIQLAPDTPEHRSFFKGGHEIYLYEGLDDAVEKAEFLLSSSKSKADSIREAAIKRSIVSGYSYKSRAEQVYRLFQKV